MVFSRRPEVPKAVCGALIGLGFLAYGITTAIDVWYGTSTTVTFEGAMLQAAQVGIVPCFAFAFACLCGSLFRTGRWRSGLAIFMVIVAYVAYSASNGIGFIATETIGKARLVAERERQARDQAELMNKQALESRKDTTEWLKRTYVGERHSRDKREILDKLTEVAQAPIALQAAAPESALADAKAFVISKWIGASLEATQMGNAAWLVALLIVGKLLGPTIGFGLWPDKNRHMVDAMTIGSGRLSAHKTDNLDNSDKWVGYAHDQARADLGLLVNNGLDLSAYGAITRLARRWAWSPQRVRRFLAEQPEFKLPPPKKRTPRKSVQNGATPALTLNGNGSAHA